MTGKAAISGIRVHRSPALLRAELAIAYVLRGGVALAGVVTAVGLAARVFHLVAVRERSRDLIGGLMAGGDHVVFEVPRSLHELVGQLRGWDPDAIMSLGLLILIALPMVRVAMTVVLFVIERDLIYLAITITVLGILIAGILSGQAPA